MGAAGDVEVSAPLPPSSFMNTCHAARPAKNCLGPLPTGNELTLCCIAIEARRPHFGPAHNISVSAEPPASPFPPLLPPSPPCCPPPPFARPALVVTGGGPTSSRPVNVANMADGNGLGGPVANDNLVVEVAAATPGGVHTATRPEPVVATGCAAGGVATSSGAGARRTRYERSGGDYMTVIVGAGCGACDRAAMSVREGVGPTGAFSIVRLAAHFFPWPSRTRGARPPPTAPSITTGKLRFSPFWSSAARVPARPRRSRGQRGRLPDVGLQEGRHGGLRAGSPACGTRQPRCDGGARGGPCLRLAAWQHVVAHAARVYCGVRLPLLDSSRRQRVSLRLPGCRQRQRRHRRHGGRRRLY